jgi:hypothetical protein
VLARRARFARSRRAFAIALGAAAFASAFSCAVANAGIVTLGSSLEGEFTRKPCANPCTVTQTQLDGLTIGAPTDGGACSAARLAPATARAPSIRRPAWRSSTPPAANG